MFPIDTSITIVHVLILFIHDYIFYLFKYIQDVCVR